jgi:peptide chain release factor subunit 1
VYVSSGYDCNAVQKQLEAEKSTAKNIKSVTTEKMSWRLWKKLFVNLKLTSRLQKNGIAIFCGNISEVEGQPDLQIWILSHLSVKVRKYRCDKEFV